jgi:hypothetical protein
MVLNEGKAIYLLFQGTQLKMMIGNRTSNKLLSRDFPSRHNTS